MNEVLSEILRTQSVVPVAGEGSIPLHSSVSQDEGVFLQEIIRSLHPKVSLDVGLAYGVSSLFICEAMREHSPIAKHIVIDPLQNHPRVFNGIGLKNLERAGYLDFVEFHELTSQVALPQLSEKGTRLDFAFIDGWHTFDHTLVDYFYIDQMLNIGGVVAFDDTNWPSIRKVCRFIATNRSYSVLGSVGGMPSDSPSAKRRFISSLTSRSSRLRAVIRPELHQSDSSLGLIGSCIAFKKVAADTRRWDFHNDF